MCPPRRHPVRTGRIYDERIRGDGVRVLVDRLWPRGLSKESAQIDEWCKEVAPSTALRKWYGHGPQRFEEFKQVAIPIAAVTGVADGIPLSITKQQTGDLPPVDIDHPDW